MTEEAPQSRQEALSRAGAEVWALPASAGRVDLQALMRRLGERQVQSVLVEGGGTVAAALLAADLVDRVYFFLAPRILGGKTAPTPVEGAGVAKLADAWRLEEVRVRRIGEDILLTGDIVRRA